MKNVKSIEGLLAAYANGERHFVDCDLDGCSLRAANLSGVMFQDSFLSCDFRGANFAGSRFERCNLKTASFCEANLTDAVITECSVESIDFKAANIENFKFVGNYYMGSIMEQSDLEGFC